MSRTFKDYNKEHVFAPHAKAAWERVTKDAQFAALLGFYTGVNPQGEALTDKQAVDHIAATLTRGQ